MIRFKIHFKSELARELKRKHSLQLVFILLTTLVLQILFNNWEPVAGLDFSRLNFIGCDLIFPKSFCISKLHSYDLRKDRKLPIFHSLEITVAR